MELRTEMLAIGGGRDKIVIDFSRFDAGQPHPPRAGNLVEFAEEMTQPKRSPARLATRRVDSVVPDVNAAEDDFAVAVSDQPADFLLDILGGATRQSRPDVRNNAVRAVEDATVLHLHEGPLAAVEVTDPAGNVDDSLARQHIAQLAFVADDLEDSGQARDGLWIARRVATHNQRARAGILPRELANDLPRLGISRAGDSARVDHAQVGRFAIERFAIPVLLERLFDELRLILIDLAAERHQAARPVLHGAALVVRTFAAIGTPATIATELARSARF